MGRESSIIQVRAGHCRPAHEIRAYEARSKIKLPNSSGIKLCHNMGSWYTAHGAHRLRSQELLISHDVRHGCLTSASLSPLFPKHNTFLLVILGTLAIEHEVCL